MWQDRRNGADNDIYGQRLAASGKFVGEGLVIFSASGDQSRPTVVHNATTNQYVVVWTDRRGTNGRSDIYGRRVGADGAMMGESVLYPNTLNTDRALPPVWQFAVAARL